MLAEISPTLYDPPARDVASAEALDLAERFLSAMRGASGRALCIDALFELLILEARDWQDDWKSSGRPQLPRQRDALKRLVEHAPLL
jgi:hypothetical protein